MDGSDTGRLNVLQPRPQSGVLPGFEPHQQAEKYPVHEQKGDEAGGLSASLCSSAHCSDVTVTGSMERPSPL